MKITNRIILAISVFAAAAVQAEESGYADPDARAHEALDLVQCISPVDSAERAIYCAKMHGNQHAVPEQNMHYQAALEQNTWQIRQIDAAGAEWIFAIDAEGRLINMTAP